MSVNVFFLLVLGLLLGMFAVFKPTYATDQLTREIPKIELQSFALYEISRNGIDHVLEGEEGKMFDDRYEVTSAKFSDNTKSLSQSIRADNAQYQSDVLRLKDNVLYRREDGLEFRSEEGQYDANASVITTQGPFAITQNANRVDGRRLYYNTEHDTVSADAVRGSYQLN
ncbi:MAG: LPS export ABC transporter periplasmic protein LptC [Campylobacterales bacterium]|nr:LPS export ABC transporter periplasmic protein LptC [Campylobacterales bacterium]